MKNNVLKILVVIGYVAMVGMNYLANALPIGGVTTGQASDSYANLFTPAGITFSIWGLIYIFLFVYTVYQFSFLKKNINQEKERMFKKINIYFLITSIANISWIFAWHYGVIWLSVLIMTMLLCALIKIADIIRKEKFSTIDVLCISTPFNLYFGWITIATIANYTVFLVSIGWNRFGLSEVVWTVSILLIGAMIGTLRMIKDASIVYGAVLIWAYSGIVLKHISVNGFDGAYPSIIGTAWVCIGIFFTTICFLMYQKKYKLKILNRTF